MFQSTWKEGWETVPPALRYLEACLRGLYKQSIQWPDDDSALASVSPIDYLITLLQPIPNIFNQLHLPGVLDKPMQCVRADLGASIYGVTFSSVDFKRCRIIPPMVISINADLFNSTGGLSSAIDGAISKAKRHLPFTPAVIVTNLTDSEILVFAKGSYQRVQTTNISQALQALTTSLFHYDLSYNCWGGSAFLASPLRPGVDDIGEDPSIPFGPPQDPTDRLILDDEIFSTHRVRNTLDKVVAHPNDCLTGLTHQSVSEWAGKTPLFPYDPADLPKETIDHINSSKRKSPLEEGGISTALQQSKSFKLQVLSILSEGSTRSMSSLYLCQITSVDEEEVQSPPVVLKLFDDRFHMVSPLEPEDDTSDDDDDDDDEDDLPVFDYIDYADSVAWNEAAAYRKLEPVQGTVLPWFYGVHRFILPNGLTLPGLLMEHIQSHKADATYTSSLGEKRRIDLIKSVRHATRVLDVANIHQKDWHIGQILFCHNPASNVDHVVLVDFAATVQSWRVEDCISVDNFFGALIALLPSADSPDWPFDRQSVLDHFGEPDEWEDASLFIPDDSGATRTISARPLFPFIPHY